MLMSTKTSVSTVSLLTNETMKLASKPTILSILCLLLSSLVCTGCSAEPLTPPPSPPTPPELPPSDATPPETIIISTPNETIDYNEVTFEWTGSDDTTPTTDLTYSCYLEGYDTTYSPFTSNTTKTYTDLSDGSYVFYVKSQDEAGNIDPTPATSEFTIATAPPEEDEAKTPIDSRLLTLPNSEVNCIAVGCNGNTIYAIDSTNAQLYKSDHGGYGWANISGGIAGAATWDNLAIAPDDPDIVAAATNAGTEVYLSVDGGTNFHATQLASKLGAGERIRCLAVSPSYGALRRDLTAGTSTGNGGGRVWVNIVDHFPSGWQDMSTGTAGWLPTPAILGGDVFAIEYSPGFAADGTLLAIVASGPAPDTDDTYLYIGIRDLASNNMTWNAFPGYPAEICQSGQDTPGTPLTYADLALPSDYSGTIISQQHVYACWSDNPPGVATAGNANDDVYRLDDAICYRLLLRPDTICSLAHYGIYNRGKLLAGATMAGTTPSCPSTQIYCTLNPQSTCPTWQSSQKPPTGPNEAQVAWSPDGEVAYCGTSSIGGASYDQSAFSLSTNNGLTWNQIGLIDT